MPLYKILLEGNVASGKSIAGQDFTDKHPGNVVFVPEPLEKWQHGPGGINYLCKMYQDQKFLPVFQSYALLTMIQEKKKAEV